MLTTLVSDADAAAIAAHHDRTPLTRDGVASSADDTAGAKAKAPPVWLVYAVVALVQLMFSIWHVLGKVALNSGVNPLVFALYRELAGTAVLAGMSRTIDKRWVVIDRADIPRFILVGMCSFGNVVGFVVALSFTTAPNASILQPSIPVWVVLLCAVAGIERLTVLKSVGVLLAVGGAAIVVVFDVSGLSGTDARGMLIGNVILIVQCFSMASILVLQKPLLTKYPPTATTLWYYGFGSVLTALASLYYARDGASVWTFGSWHEGLALAYAVVVATAVAYSLVSWSVAHIPSTMVSVFYPLQPFFTSILSMAFLGDTMNIEQAAGAVLIVAGLFCTLWKKNAPNATATAAADTSAQEPSTSSAVAPNGYHVLTPTPTNPSISKSGAEADV